MSAPVGAATPTVPGAPTITSITTGHRSVKVAFTKPASAPSDPVVPLGKP